jgi:hypothetical protein
MILDIKTKFPNNKGILSDNQTFFMEKIWACFNTERLIEFFKEQHEIDFNDQEAVSKLLKTKAGYKVNWGVYND